MALLSEAQLGAGDAAAARASADVAVDLARRYRRPISEIGAHLVRSRALVASGDGGAEEALASAQALVERTGTAMFSPFLAVVRADLAARLGDDAARDQALCEAERGFQSIGATTRAAAVARLRGA